MDIDNLVWAHLPHEGMRCHLLRAETTKRLPAAALCGTCSVWDDPWMLGNGDRVHCKRCLRMSL